MTRAFTAVIIVAGLPAAHGQAPKSTCPLPPATEARPWLNPQYSPRRRAQFVLSQFRTLDDKFAYLSAGGAGRAAATPAIDPGLIRGGGVDGPAGVARGAGVTAFPTPLSI